MKNKQNFEIKTNRLLLRPFSEEDINKLHELFTSSGVRKYLWDDQIISIEQTKNIINESLKLFKQNKYGLWAIFEFGKEKIIGFSGYWYFHEPPELELLYGLDEKYWSRGYATEASEAMIKYGFNELGFDRIIASTDAPNTASIKVMEKLGMTFLKRELKNNLDTIFYEIYK